MKTILDMYPDGNPILSELIQNADDAGASVVRILVDENSYDSVSLLNPSMAPLQGPALLVGTTAVDILQWTRLIVLSVSGNDAQFAESDFRSLASIGQGSKLDKLTATGEWIILIVVNPISPLMLRQDDSVWVLILCIT